MLFFLSPVNLLMQVKAQSPTLKKRSSESWMDLRGRVFLLRGRSIDRSLNCSRFVITSPQLNFM